MNTQAKQLACFLLLFQCSLIVCAASAAELTIDGEQLLLDGVPTKAIGLRCSNSLISDKTTDELIAQLDPMREFGINTVSVFIMGSRFGDLQGYHPDGTMDGDVRRRLVRVIEETKRRDMICIVGCLYWSTSKAKAKLTDWGEKEAAAAVAGTARWLAQRGDKHVILDVDNEGMFCKPNKYSTDKLIQAAKQAAPDLIVASNVTTGAATEDINLHHSPPESGKPWFDSEASPNTPGGYWGTFSKKTHQANPKFYNYSRIGRYSEEMKADQFKQAHQEIRDHAGYGFTSTWLQCSPNEGIGGPSILAAGVILENTTIRTHR